MVDIAGIKMRNPVMVASGTFGFGEEYSKLIDLNKLGAVITKSVTLNPRDGNPPPRLCETPAGMLNSIGLQNDGLKVFLEKQLPFLSQFDVPIIVNVAGETIEEYVEVSRALSNQPKIKGLELNISCPNVKKGGMAFGIDPKATKELVESVRLATKLPLIAKLSPNVTDITEIAKAAVSAGADALSLINTVMGMAIDIKTKKPKLATITGGLSGPAIKPIAIRMVWQVAQVVDVPIIGIGGIMTAEDAYEFILAGAKAVQIGTANFVDVEASLKIIEGLKTLTAGK
ncbi:MAG: dihydroorotate dehydrogenase [Candidatus Margulisiibacteriota bacterium]